MNFTSTRRRVLALATVAVTALAIGLPAASAPTSAAPRPATHGAVRAVAALAPQAARASAPRPAAVARHWVGSWSASPQKLPAPDAIIGAHTLRQIVHPSLGGRTLRLRLANTFGTGNLVVTKAAVARAVSPSSAGLVTGTSRPVTFGGSATVTVTDGAKVLSDPVRLPISFGQDLAVDLTVTTAAGSVTGHAGQQGGFVADGDAVGGPATAFTGRVSQWFYLDGIDVAASRKAAAVVALGDSITDGAYSTYEGNARWTDVLATRLRSSGARLSVLNQGIGGNQITRDRTDCCPESVSALARLDRDVLAQTGRRTLIVAEGINDLGYSVPAADIIAGMQQIARQSQAVGLKVIVGTITPYGCDSGCLGAQQEADRQTVNRWVRTTADVDGFVDFDRAVRDPEHRDRLLAAYDAGDHLHLNDAGYRAMGYAVHLRQLR